MSHNPVMASTISDTPTAWTSGDGATIRPFAPADAPAIAALIQDILAAEFTRESPAFPAADLQQLATAYGGPENAFFVAEAGGRIVGTCGVKQDGPSAAILRRLFVAPAHRRRGLGARLTKTAIDFCKAQRYRTIKIRTSDRMATAMAICRRHGFREDARMPLGAVQLVHLTLRLD